MKKPTPFNRNGFTLIEIIAVLVILGFLAAVAIPKYIDLHEKARKKAAQSAISETRARLSMSYAKYLLVNGVEPADIATLTGWVNDTDILPTTDGGIVNMGADFAVTLGFTPPNNISVTHVQAVPLAAAETGTWALP